MRISKSHLHTHFCVVCRHGDSSVARVCFLTRTAQTEMMQEALHKAGAHVDRVVYMFGKSHTDPILEDPAGGEDPLMVDLIAMVHAGTSDPAILPRRLPKILQRLARWLNPF